MKEFKLIVAGGREFNNYSVLSCEIGRLAFGELNEVNVSIVSGCARGADALAVQFAEHNDVKLYRMPADWNTGRGAGFARNVDMANMSDGLLAFWDGKSTGTKHMIESMRRMGKPVWVVYY